MQFLNNQHPEFKQQLKDLLAFETAQNSEVDAIVANICQQIKANGDQALIQYTNQFDRMNVTTIAELSLTKEELKFAFDTLAIDIQQALIEASERIKSYHQHQLQKTWQYQDEDGNILGQKITPLDRVGIYVPGGKASYPSSVLMNAIPAHVAGVKEITMVVPTPQGEKNQTVLAAAYIAGVNRVFTIGGAQAVAALAYGTETIAAVDKITGPGNAFVAAAKRQVFGVVGIDMVAGPSEILIISDGKTDPEWIATDLFSQAEHDEIAQSILISPDAAHLKTVQQAIKHLLPSQPRKAIIEASLNNRGAMILVNDLDEACAIANYIAPEHLELSIDEPEPYLAKINHAGAIFIGRYTTESLGDYCAGPNHVLPTSRTARFASPLGVYDFQKRSSLIKVSEQGVQKLGKIASTLAKQEGLFAHAAAAELRLKK